MTKKSICKLNLYGLHSAEVYKQISSLRRKTTTTTMGRDSMGVVSRNDQRG